MPTNWTLLIYTIPAEPSRKRAAVWRDLKKLGAVYLRDGVCALPERTDTAQAFRAVAAQIAAFRGQATLVESARLDAARTGEIMAQVRTARVAEYQEITREAEGFLAHVRRETAHRELTLTELMELKRDLSKLQRWAAQVRSRDYYGVEEAAAVVNLLERCEENLGTVLEQVARHQEAVS